MQHHKQDGEAFSLLHLHQRFLRGCCGCKILWIDPGAGIHQLTEQEFWSFSRALISLNQYSVRLCASDFAQYDIHFSSTICPTCAQQSCGAKYRKKQALEGNVPCFGSARNGYCDQFSCKYRTLCITSPEWDPCRETYYHHIHDQHIQKHATSPA